MFWVLSGFGRGVRAHLLVGHDVPDPVAGEHHELVLGRQRLLDDVRRGADDLRLRAQVAPLLVPEGEDGWKTIGAALKPSKPEA